MSISTAALALLLAPSFQDQVEPPTLLEPPALFAFGADQDGNGEVTRQEWAAHVEQLAPLLASQSELIAALFTPVLDLDADGSFTRADFEAWLPRLDGSGNGTLDKADADKVFGPTRAQFNDVLVGMLMLRALDSDRSGTVEPAELEAARTALDDATDAWKQGTLLSSWISDARKGPSEQGALTAEVILLGVTSDLDLTADGSLGRDDLAALFTQLDANQDGVLTRDEWVPARGAPAPGRATAEAWPVATEADRAKPALVPWQRSLDDALALSQQTGRPLLVCVNMDGETASDALALVRYKDADFVELMRGFVPVLASPDRHTVRDRDDRGRRVVDPRFGRLVDSEHIDIEPLVYERYFDGNRVAPRHVGIAPDGSKLFDLYLLRSFAPLEEKLAQHGLAESAAAPPSEPPLSDPAALLASPAAAHREAVEALFVTGTSIQQQSLARAAYEAGRATEQPELLWLALHSPLAEVRTAGALELAENVERAPRELVGRALAEPSARAAVIEALATKLAEEPWSARAIAAYEGLQSSSAFVDPQLWGIALAWAPATVPESADPDLVNAKLARLDRLLSGEPENNELAMAFTSSMLALADIEAQAGRNPTFLYEDARAKALEIAARTDAASDARPLALAAWAAHQLGDFEAAGQAAESALPHLLPWAGTPLAARTLSILADVRLRKIYARIGADESFPASWVADFDACHAALREHPLDAAPDVVTWYDALGTLDVRLDQPEVLRRALARFPEDNDLHQRLRGWATWTGGAEALAEVYDDLELPADSEASWTWFEALAQFLAAERGLENGMRWHPFARETYDASIASFEAAIALEPDYADTSLHYVALAHGALARIALEQSDLLRAAAHASAALAARPASAELEDGLGQTPADTAQRVYRALRSEEALAEPREALRTALEAADLRVPGGSRS